MVCGNSTISGFSGKLSGNFPYPLVVYLVQWKPLTVFITYIYDLSIKYYLMLLVGCFSRYRLPGLDSTPEARDAISIPGLFPISSEIDLNVGGHASSKSLYPVPLLHLELQCRPG